MAPLLRTLVQQGSTRLFVTLVSLAIMLLFAWLLQAKVSPLEGMEWRMYDSYFRLHGPQEPPAELVVVTIDEDSLSELGHWPWDRSLLAELVDHLHQAGAAVIMFDVMFPEETEQDPLFSRAIEESGRVIMPLAFTFDRETWVDTDDYMLESSFLRIENSAHFEEYPPIIAPGILTPVAALMQPALSLGSVQVFPDDDGVLRWEPLVVGYDDYVYPSAALITAARYLGKGVEELTYIAGKGIQLDAERLIPVDEWGRTLIHYYSGGGAFPYLSAADVIRGRFDPVQVQDKVVLFGATAVGLYDLVVSPYSAGQPGVEKHASVIAAFLEQRFIRTAPPWLDMALLLAAGLLFTASAVLLRAKGAFVSGLLLSLVVLLLGYGVFVEQGVMIRTGHTFVMLLLCFMITTTVKYLGEEQRAGTIKSLFSNYVTARVVNELIRNPEIAKLGGQRKKVTILFSDIRNFTTFSENHSPEAVVTSLNEYLGEMTDTVFKYEGTLDKYIGDAVMAFWGAPLEQEEQGRLAVECALEMLERLELLNDRWRRQGRPPFEIGIGINTGEALVGNVGADGKKMDYTVIGDTVNLASRCESLNKTYNTHLLITEFTVAELNQERVEVDYGLRDLGEVLVKGKGRAVRFYATSRAQLVSDDE